MPISTHSGQMRRTYANWRDGAVLIALWLFCTALNFDKAFHIDDAGHLVIAQWIAHNPLHPMSGELFWGNVPEPIYVTNQPHLYFYAMAGWGSVFGWSEKAMHALQSIFCLLALVGMYRLSVRFVPRWPLVPTALLAFSPAFVVNQNSMVEIPLLALWLGFFVALCGTQKSASNLLNASIWCSAALLTKYTSLVLLLVLFLEVFRGQRLRDAAVLLVPLATVLAWSIFNYWDYGGIHIAQRKPGGTATDASAHWFATQAYGWLLALGAIAPAGIGLVAVGHIQSSIRLKPLRISLIALTAIVAMGAAASTANVAFSETTVYRLTKLFFLVGGIVLVAASAGRLLKERSRARATHTTVDPGLALLAVWALGAFTFIVALAPFMATRHVLLALPPLLLLASRWLTSGASKRWLVGVVAVSSLFATSIAMADRWYADIYRTQAVEIRQSLPPDATVWFAGHWGWQWYATQVGMLPFDPSLHKHKAGDYLVYPESVSRQDLPTDIPMTPVREVVINPDGWFTPFAMPSAGMYISSMWTLPWTVNFGNIEVFHIVYLGSAMQRK